MVTIDTGDTVFHRPSRETWIVAYVRGDRLCACGWPESLAVLDDCLLVEKASAAERMRLLRDMAGSSGSDSRVRYARAALALGRLAAIDRELGLDYAPPAQEPGFEDVRVRAEIINRFPELNPSNFDDEAAQALNAWGLEVVLDARPIVDPQPAREPLTDEEAIALANAAAPPMGDVWVRDPDAAVLRIVRAIERAHGIGEAPARGAGNGEG